MIVEVHWAILLATFAAGAILGLSALGLALILVSIENDVPEKQIRR